MKKQLLILICLFVSFEVKSKPLNLTGKKILCVSDSFKFIELSFFKNNKVKIRRNNNWKRTFSFVKEGVYSFEGDNEDYLQINYDLTPEEKAFIEAVPEDNNFFYMSIYLKEMKDITYGSDQCFFFKGNLDYIIKENLKVFDHQNSYLEGNIAITLEEKNSFYNKGTKFVCQEKNKIGFNFDENNSDKTRPVKFNDETFKFVESDDIFQMIKIINSKLGQYKFFTHDLFDRTFYFQKKIIGSESSLDKDNFKCQLRNSKDQYTHEKIDTKNLILECKKTSTYSENINLNLKNGKFIRSVSEGNLEINEYNYFDSIYISHGVCEKM